MDNKHAENKLWDKTKSILFAFKFRKKNVKKLEDTTIKKHNKFKYLGCILDEAMSGKVLPL